MRVARKLVAAFLLVALLAACDRQEKSPLLVSPKPATNAPPHATTAPQPKPARMVVLPETIAQISGDKEVPVLASVSGYLVQQKWKWHAMITRPGDVLFLIDPRQAHGDSSGSASKDLVPVVAPVAGVLQEVRHGPGDYVEHGEALATMMTVDQVEAEFSLPLDGQPDLVARIEETAALPPGSRVADIELVQPDGTAYPKWGTIASARREGRHCIVVVQFPNPDHALQPGAFVRVRSGGGL